MGSQGKTPDFTIYSPTKIVRKIGNERLGDASNSAASQGADPNKEKPQSLILNLITWPIENVDTCTIQKLKLVGWQIQRNIQKLNNLFAANAFVNTDKLYIKDFLLSTPL